MISRGIMVDDFEEVGISKKKQLRRDRAFRKLIIDTYANEGIHISNKEAMKIFRDYKKKSSEQKQEMRDRYIQGASLFRGYDVGGYAGRGIVATQDIPLAPGEEDISDNEPFDEEEEHEEIKYKRAKEKEKKYNKLTKELEKLSKRNDDTGRMIREILNKYK